MEYVNIFLRADELVFAADALRITDVRRDEYVIPYEEIVIAYIAVCSGEESETEQSLRDSYAPEITDITKDTTGSLVIYNRQQNCFVIRMDSAGAVTAGQVIGKLTQYAPHALFGFQPWLNEYDDKQYEEILEMVDIMKECVG